MVPTKGVAAEAPRTMAIFELLDYIVNEVCEFEVFSEFIVMMAIV